MNNAEYLLKQGIKFNDLGFYPTDTLHTFCIRNNKTHDILGTIKANTTFTALQRFPEWLDEEHVGNVLTAEEKAYLSVVIKPFRDRILSISKEEHCSDDGNAEHLWFAFNDDSEDEFSLPSFKAGTAYRGMVLYHYYTLEDLGL